MISTLFAFLFASISVGICGLSLWNYILRDRLRFQEERLRNIYASARHWESRAMALVSRIAELEDVRAADWWKEESE